MGWDFLVKPAFDGGGGGVVSQKTGTMTIKSPDGQVLETVSIGGSKGEAGYKAQSKAIAAGLPAGSTIDFTSSDGQQSTFKLTEDGARHEFVFGNPNPTLVSSKGAVGSAGGGAGGSFAPGSIGFGATPAFIGDQFPKAKTVPTISIPGGAPTYTYVDPLKFANQFAPFQGKLLKQTFAQSRDFAQQAIDQELSTLEGFVPRSAQLSRTETAKDNVLNQLTRTAQVNSAVPDVVRDLNAVAADARTYASGEVPNSQIDKGLELSNRSAAADLASAGGFGAGSGTGRRLSELMSAKDRIALSQYGEGLLGQNAQQRADLLLAPTSYSNTGQQVGIMPSVSTAGLVSQGFQELNRQVLLSPETAFQSSIQQSQFLTNLVQRTQEFNATNYFQNEQFNASTENNFALSYFNYLNSYVNSLAGAAQTNIDTGVAIDQQNMARDEANKQKDKTQKGNDINAGINAIFGIGAAILGGFYFGPIGGGGGVPGGSAITSGVDSAVNAVKSIF